MKRRTVVLRMDTIVALNRLRQGDESYNSLISRMAKRALLYAEAEEKQNDAHP